MTYENFTLETDSDGIAVVTWDMPERSMNVLTESSLGELTAIVERIATEDAITAAIITSGKSAFCAGADLSMMERHTASLAKAARDGTDMTAATAEMFESIQTYSRVLRRLETCGKPVVAAVKGVALGGGFELALACHCRIATGDSKLGLPEARVGLLPGGGGTQRLPRLIGASDALQLMLQGRNIDAEKGAKAGLVHKVVDADDLVAEAKRWIAEQPTAVQPWDEEKFRVPGGLPYSKGGMMMWGAANALYRRETLDNYPAQRAIMSCVYEGLQMPMDTALRIEARYFTWLLRQPEAKNMIRSLFLSMQELNKLARRPADVPEFKVRKLGVLGAGMMGAGIAYVSARAGMQVVLIDRDQESAERGKAYSDGLMDKAIKRGRASQDDKQKLLSMITATDDYDALEGCDLIIEAVFESRELKAEVTPNAEAKLAEGGVFASNTSTLPITSLAKASARPESFIGIHFFSPVDKMMLVEIIMGKETSDEALAKALDYVRAIRKTPIVVNDSRGFYTSRVVSTYIAEGHHMLAEGIPAAMIENVGRMAGMPVGPLALNDEVSLDLAWKIAAATRADLGDAYVETPRDAILGEMVEKQGRLGRKNGKGFYDYPQDGKKRLWADVDDLVSASIDPDGVDVEDLKARFLTFQALETARCFEEGVLTDVRDADIGAILGWGFAPFTGGPLSYIDTMGAKAFVAQCERLAGEHGERFTPNALLRDLAAKGETFYTRFNPHAPSQKAA